jgi:hypothetical protein
MSLNMLNFEYGSSNYHFMASQGSYYFYSGLTSLKAAGNSGTPLPTNLSKSYL